MLSNISDIKSMDNNKKLLSNISDIKSMDNTKLLSNISDLFLFSALFPFVNFNLVPVDTQPFTFLIGILVLHFLPL